MGQDAATAIIPSFIAPLDVTDPAEAVRKSVAELRGEVDFIVLLTHQERGRGHVRGFTDNGTDIEQVKGDGVRHWSASSFEGRLVYFSERRSIRLRRS